MTKNNKIVQLTCGIGRSRWYASCQLGML